MQITLKQLISAINAAPAHQTGSAETLFTGVSTDTRTVQAGDCFFAIVGDNFDGHDYISAAAEKGAACIIASDSAKCRTIDIPHLIVPDTVRALGELARWYRNQLGAKVVAITGSAGKTTTRHITHHVLSKHYCCHQAPKSFNNHIGLPLTLLTAERHHDIIIAELGTNNPGEIEYLTSIAQPDIALVNNVAPAHLEGFGCVENIAIEKTAIRQGLKPDGTFIINADCPELLDHCTHRNIAFTSFGTSRTADIVAGNLATDTFSGTFEIDRKTVTVPLPGFANLLNTIAAYAITSLFSINIDDFAAALADIDSPQMRLNIRKVGGLTVINDCYNANPASMQNAVRTLSHIASRSGKRSVFICGHMAELGEHTETLHAELGEQIGQARIDLLIATGPSAQTTVAAAQKNSTNGLQTHIFPDVKSLCNKLQDFVQPDDIILIKGSRSAKLETVVNSLVSLFG